MKSACSSFTTATHKHRSLGAGALQGYHGWRGTMEHSCNNVTANEPFIITINYCTMHASHCMMPWVPSVAQFALIDTFQALTWPSGTSCCAAVFQHQRCLWLTYHSTDVHPVHWHGATSLREGWWSLHTPPRCKLLLLPPGRTELQTL